jgi:hypothetical protein
VLAERELEETDGGRKGKQGKKERIVEYGRVILSGERASFTIATDHRPLDFWIDKHREVLATFSCETREPKSVLLHRAADLAATGDAAGAEAALRLALESPLEVDPTPDPEDEHPSPVVLARRTKLLDGRIHLELARLHLDQGKDASARAELEAAHDSLGSAARWAYQSTWDHLKARLDLRSGNYLDPYKRLRKYLFPTAGDVSTEGIALLAVAANRAGKLDDFRKAAELCDKRGVDLAALK